MCFTNIEDSWLDRGNCIILHFVLQFLSFCLPNTLLFLLLFHYFVVAFLHHLLRLHFYVVCTTGFRHLI